MDCCLVRVAVLLFSCNIILGCPQHHRHHYEPPKRNTVVITNLLKEENTERNLKTKGGVEEEIVLQINDVTLPAQTPSNSSGINENQTRSDDTPKFVECVCALFSVRSPIETDAPLMSKTFYNVSCDRHVSGKDACSEVCVAFATSHYKQKDNIICSRIYNATGLTVSLHSKHCAANSAWAFTGLQSEKPLCCKNGEPVLCEEKTSATTLEY